MGRACKTHREKRNAYIVWVGNSKKRDHYEDVDVGASIILKRILEKENGLVQTGFIWVRMSTTGGLL
jgi:hypothetical protein